MIVYYNTHRNYGVGQNTPHSKHSDWYKNEINLLSVFKLFSKHYFKAILT